MSGVLLDTHCWLWFASDPTRLGPKARSLLTDPDTKPFLSVASIWEIAIKQALHKLQLPMPVGEFVVARGEELGFELLAIESAHAVEVAALPDIHRDPFDRILIAQARVEKLRFMTADALLWRYPVESISAGS